MRSEVWDHFNRSEDNIFSTCKFCNVRLKNGSTTTPLWNHIRSIHGKDSRMATFLSQQDPQNKRSYEENDSSTDNPSTSSSSSYSLLPSSEPQRKKARQSKSGYIDASDRLCNSTRAEIITQAIAYMLSVDMLPFSFVEGEGFKKLMAVVEPSYKIPCPKTIVARIHALYEEKKEMVKKEVSSADWVALDCDSWTSIAMNSYTTINAHYIDSDWKLQTRTLSTRDCGERHTSDNLKSELKDVAADFGIKEDHISGCTTDNAKNVSNAADELVEGTRCAAHTIQLPVSVRAGTALQVVKEVLDKSSAIVGHFKHSTVAMAALQSKQNQMYKKEEIMQLAQRCPTRFDSELHMCRTTIRNKSALNAVFEDRTVTKLSVAKKLEMTNSEWATLEDIQTVLTPLEVATRVLCTNKTPTLSMVQPIMRSLLDNHLAVEIDDSDIKRSLKANIASNLKIRFKMDPAEPNEPVSLAQLSAAVDPRYKSLAHEDVGDRSRIWAELEFRLCLCRGSESEGSSEPTVKPSNFETDLDFLLQRPTTSRPSSVSEELENFRNSPQATGDPLQWWQTNEKLYPRISQLAKRFLCIAGSSVQSERTFSAAGNIVSAKRSCLRPENVNKLVFLYQNNTNKNVKC